MRSRKKKPEVQPPPLHLIHEEVNRQRESTARRSDAMNGRATVLIGAAAIAGSLQASDLFGNGWLIIAVAATALAALCGILAVTPKPRRELDMKMVRNTLFRKTDDEALLFLIDHKNDALAEIEKLLSHRARWLRRGYVCLVISILAFVPLVARAQLTITIQ
ncbi:hypothetical protein HDC94_000931 [Leifsonia sp. AK011]|uniref:hypothetical protein n=1 Tax=Leifsonia sp. AK011 TaxID=2723075 RepID=UPI0015C8A608|nr:hypothetical protein [Leifsonia sp. AK011]NYF09775.1 hypothetical protein [Leifsonia sp. AK011]